MESTDAHGGPAGLEDADELADKPDGVIGMPADPEEAEMSLEPESDATRRDPIASALLIAALTLVIALLATTVGVYVFLTNLNSAPRTAAERDIASAEMAAKERPTDIQAWTDLAYAYAAVGRDGDALDAVKTGESLKDSEILSIVRADVLRLSGRLKEALDAYNVAEKQVKKLFARQMDAAKKMGITADLTDDSLARVYWGRALTQEALGDTKKAVADLEKSVKEDPTQASAWAKLGDYYAELNKPDKAEAAYKSALKYIPDMQEALDGLKRLGRAGD